MEELHVLGGTRCRCQMADDIIPRNGTAAEEEPR